MTKTAKKHKHLKTKVKIAGKIFDKAHRPNAEKGTPYMTLTIDVDDLCDAFGMSLEEMNEYLDFTCYVTKQIKNIK